MRARRVDAGQGFPLGVLVVVEEDLPGALRDVPLGRDVLRVSALQEAAERLRHRADLRVLVLPDDGHVDVQPRRARGLDE